MKNSNEKSKKSEKSENFAFSSIPRHVAIIMDGNGRWAEAHGLPRIEGHRSSRKAIKDAVIAAAENNIEVLSLFAFSTENWKRPHKEIMQLFRIFTNIIREELPELKERNVRVIYSGDLSKFPKYLKNILNTTENETKNNSGLILNICLDYSGKSEILKAIKKILNSKLKTTDIDENIFESFLDTAGLPPVDLLIRTSGEQRISNFMLWQIAYAELYFTNTLWPDFSKDEFIKALQEYQKRDRRFGGLKK
ncbi:MAG: polyprenyl diphosphate synthase [Caldisericia bacterium]|jgi:undecaprenyl diphosphate synthase|nr:di-trans,poly-cis-decaprenylcistransferase [Caldisericia bacterium]MDD3427386.1 polyprenyl diphosphate synthase [Caldisericia bacterium]MDD5688829.1 polyprenyl diphosphate synthase [Caldisericia bacterium]HOJ16755.1 polyprenyl diphosphate synthase [Caldisericia bacterium]HOW02462.1 polyprenyl diphosphate synthase [Caldisericia bacterium]